MRFRIPLGLLELSQKPEDRHSWRATAKYCSMRRSNSSRELWWFFSSNARKTCGVQKRIFTPVLLQFDLFFDISSALAGFLGPW